MNYKELFKNRPYYFFLLILIGLIGVVGAIIRVVYIRDSISSEEIRVIYILILFLLVLIINILIKEVLPKKKRIIVSSIEQNNLFWDGDNYKELWINALNGIEFIEQVIDLRIKVNKILLIVPSEQSVRAYYDSDSIVTNKLETIILLKKSIEDAKHRLSEAQSNSIISFYDVKEISRFPLEFYATLDNKKCITGHYLKNKSRARTVGLRSNSWTTDDSIIVGEFREHFDNLWHV